MVLESDSGPATKQAPLLSQLSCWLHLSFLVRVGAQNPEHVGMVGTVTSQADSSGAVPSGHSC